MIRLRAMTIDDVWLGMRLKEQAGWNQIEADWYRFLALEPEGCFVAELDGRPVATTTTCVFDSVAWIAMVLVDEPARHQGIATRLVDHAVQYLENRDVRTVRLDATPLGRPVYERLGFVAEYELVRLQGTASASLSGQSTLPEVPDNFRAAAELDRQITGTGRHRLLEAMYRERPDAARVVLDGPRTIGYAMLRAGARATQIGPAVALTPEAGFALLDWGFRQCDKQSVFVDIPRDNHQAIDWAKGKGLETQRPFTRMYRGRPVQDQVVHLWASSGPEKG
jgi:GNAT superfamily N-acetyltransferase